MSMMRSYPLEEIPPACSTMKDIGLASYSKRSLPPLVGSFVSLGYRNTPPRVRMRCTSATIDATQRILKLIPRGPVFPATLIGRIDGKFHRVRRNDHVRMGQHEFADVAIQSEAIHAMTGGDHQHGCWAIQRITGTNLRSAGLQKVRCGRIRYAFRCAQNREYRPNRDVHVDVGRTVQRIK